MPIKTHTSLPATKQLESENIFVMTETRAMKQDIRPLKIAILNLMPLKIVTETQLLRLLGNSPLQVEIDFIKTSSYTSTNTPEAHLLSFYKTFDEIKENKYDGMIITGAPVELLEFEEVTYWDELCGIMEWSKKSVTSTFHICWGAQAALYYHYGIKKCKLEKKLSGVYEHTVNRTTSKLMRGFDDIFYAPHSRWTDVKISDIKKVKELEILAESDKAGAYILFTKGGRQVFVMGHSEYDPKTLHDEYIRDMERGDNPNIPFNYYVNDDVGSEPIVRWRSHASLLFSNWLNYFVYQITPYDINKIK